MKNKARLSSTSSNVRFSGHTLSNPRFSCGCTLCSYEREKNVRIGSLCKPILLEGDSRYATTAPYWRLGEWTKNGFMFRFSEDENFLLVVGEISKDDKENTGSFESVICFSPRMGTIVTMRSKLEVIASPL